MGIDHAKRTGYSVCVDGIIKETGAIEIINNSLFKYYMDILDKISIIKPDIVVLEESSHLRNAKILRQLMSYQSVIRLACEVKGFEYHIVNPKEVKKTITGKGNSDKHEVMEALINKHNVNRGLVEIPVYYKNKDGIKEYKYDESDASALTLFYWYKNK